MIKILTKLKKNVTIHIIEVLFYGRRKMSGCKQSIAMAFCGIMLLVKPASAFWPVFDFMEIIPVTSQVSTAAEAFVQVKSQLMQLSETLKALAAKGGTIAQFSKKIKKHLSSVGDQASSTSDGVSQNLKTNDDVQDNLDQIADKINEGQQILIDQTVDHVNNVLNHRFRPLIIKTDDDDRGNDQPQSIEEEEEEEEVSEKQALKEDVLEVMKNIREDSAELTMQLNDAFEEVIAVMNKNAQENHQMLSDLNKSLRDLANVDLVKKQQLQDRLAALTIREQNVSNWGISIAEAERDKYNQESKSKIQEGLNNYQKVVLAYIDGHASKEDVSEAGNTLKKQAKSISVKPDAMVISKYKQEIAAVQEEISNITTEIKELLNTSDSDNTGV